MAALRLQLKIVIRVAYHPVVPDGPLVRKRSRELAGRLYKFFQSTYSAKGTPYCSIHARSASVTAQMVSCSPNCAQVMLVASSAMSIKQPPASSDG